MAQMLQAVREFGPQLVSGRLVEVPEMAVFIAGRTGLQRSQTTACLIELEEALEFFCMAGRPVRLNGLGIFRLSVAQNGRRRMKFKAAGNLLERVNRRDYVGEIQKLEAVKYLPEDYKALWDAAHPEDPLELAAA